MFLVHYLLARKSMIKKQTQQTAMDIFMERVTPPQEEPQAGSSETIPEGGIALLGDHSSCLLVPWKTCQWDKMWAWETVMSMILTVCRPRLTYVFRSFSF